MSSEAGEPLSTPVKVAMAQHPPTWSHAHYTRPELDGLRHAYAAAQAVPQAAVAVHPRASEMRLRAERDTGIVALALSGGYPEMPRKSDGTVTTRQEQLDAAWFHRTRAIEDSLPAAIDVVEFLPTTPARLKAAMHLKDALHLLKGIDPTLAYADPTPQELMTLTIGDRNGEPMKVTQTEPAVVGPHGMYWFAIAQCFWTTHYARDLIEVVNKLLSDKKYKAKWPQLKHVQRMYPEIQRWQYDCSAKVAGVVDDPADRFCSILYVGDTLWSSGPKPGLPKWYFQLTLTLSEVATDDVLLRAMFKALGDLWLQSNRIIEGLMTENEPLRKRCR